MKYTITMNQKVLIDSGLKLDITDGAIIDFIHSFIHSEEVHKLIHAGKIFYWISYGLVSKQLPILRLKKDTVYRKFKQYIDMGLLDAHPDNQQLNRAYFAINSTFMRLFYSDELAADLRTEIRRSYGKKSIPPTDKNPDYNTIIDNSKKIKEDGLDLWAGLPHCSTNFMKVWEEWLSYRKRIRKPIRTQRLLDKELSFLKQFPEDEAIKVIEQSIDRSWIGLFELKEAYKKKDKQTEGGSAFAVHV